MSQNTVIYDLKSRLTDMQQPNICMPCTAYLAESQFGQNDTLARVTFGTETLWPETVWLERQFGQ